MFDKTLVLKIFEGFSIERWNDLVRPFELIEMDKTAEKTVLAYIIGKYEEKRGNAIEWERIIYSSLFDLLRKIALCDIKAPVLRMIRAEYPEEYARLNEWVVGQYRTLILDDELFARFSSYVLEPADQSNLTVRVFRAAHKYSTFREVEMIRMVNEPFRLTDIDRGINKDLEEFLDLRGLQLLVAKQQPWEFLTEIEKLRFQTRWNQTPRVPATSVLGHSYFVAALTLLMGRCIGVSPEREYNNFFSALFHDLPEAVTRDIISPVKQATHQLPLVVKDVEDKIVERELLPLMDTSFRDELVYFTSHEFENRVWENGRTHVVDFSELAQLCSICPDVALRPVDGKIVRAADHIAAFVEADCSIAYGITSNHLRDGKKNILSMYPDGKTVNGIDVAAFFRTFD